jgi:DNA-binding LytR/AlgR family response regulator
MIRAVLADDERASLLLLREALQATGQVTVEGEAEGGLQCLRLMEQLKPDVLFLDIQMDDLSGLEVAEIALETANPPLIVFITGYEMYAVKAFELSALDYILKPTDLRTFEERIQATVSRIALALQQPGPVAVDAARNVLAQIAQENQHLQATGKVPVKDHDEHTVRLLDVAAVVYAETSDGGVLVHTCDKPFVAYHSLEKLAQRLSHERFFRAGGALINLDYVSHLMPNVDGSYDALLRAERGAFLHTVVLTPPHAKELLALLGL